ncbi:hypothetical protein GCM10010129_36240 [Streptomyces fumigatiscleroticus]|nr:hypothetical protein GCM10010129_36240 [Streptomyces fumigatiscleroticus]
MRATAPLAVAAALAAALSLTACDDGSGDDTGSGTTATARTGAACAIDDLDVRVDASPAPAAGDTGTVSVTVTNGGSACTLDGFPAVTLKAGDASADVPQDEAATAQKMTLDEGAAASFTVTYVRGATGAATGLAAKTAEFALPGASATHSFPWSYGEVALKGDTKAPDASVSPFQQNGD